MRGGRGDPLAIHGGASERDVFGERGLCPTLQLPLAFGTPAFVHPTKGALTEWLLVAKAPPESCFYPAAGTATRMLYGQHAPTLLCSAARTEQWLGEVLRKNAPPWPQNLPVPRSCDQFLRVQSLGGRSHPPPKDQGLENCRSHRRWGGGQTLGNSFIV